MANQFDGYTAEREQRVRNLLLMDYTARQIAEATKIPLSTVYRYIDSINREYTEWYNKNKSRKTRVSAYYAEMLDKLKRNVQERWVLFHNTPLTDRDERREHLDGILRCYHEMRDHLALVAPRLDSVALEEEMNSLEKLAFQVRQAQKVKPLAQTDITATG